MKNQKPKLLIDWATHEAALYACKKWHYSKCLPAGKTVKFGVWENNIFIGVVVFSMGPSPNIAKTFSVPTEQLSELSRIALNRHKTEVTKIVSISIKLFRKFCPGNLIIVSYADQNMGHAGTIYKAGAWKYCGEYGPKVRWVFHSGKPIHERNMRQRVLDGKNTIDQFRKISVLPKHKFIMDFRATSIENDATSLPAGKGQCDSDRGAPIKEKRVLNEI